jgi:hypothetical protein
MVLKDIGHLGLVFSSRVANQHLDMVVSKNTEKSTEAP